eukprot:CAMPEP_0114336026 /NCGR_PEP_ID=MMETSP0101-20121206/5439_1 /TAXON_ID=38822 ORGANISM="Pteridomonas danica, Strain PT" /NCGR_SAMPLE_ID=MMETSP0101 /ASSEMBLY_ACC=CAM_ASM_000211 /LENGTH=554 /DNA_ID=CAMNT_0001467825 /DNA_START=184 /DNA_END=1848 /DNA_ORIENTATION=-
MNLIRLQNDTITSLKVRLQEMEKLASLEMGGNSKLESLYNELTNKQLENDALRASIENIHSENEKEETNEHHLAKIGDTTVGLSTTDRLLPNILRSDFDEECEHRFGLGLSDNWRNTKEEWCTMPSHQKDDDDASSIHCYPYHQEHKKQGRRAQKDMFCEGKNIFIDFNQIKGTHSKTKPPLGSQYLNFGSGATFASCQKTGKWTDSLFMPHMARQLGRMVFGKKHPNAHYEKGSTYLLARDEDCENMFHSSADHINIYNVAQILGLDFNALQVALFDRHFDGPFYELISRAFSPNHPLKRIGDYNGKVVQFEHVIWHLESPAGIVFPKVGGPTGLMQCHHSSLWEGYRKHVLNQFDLLNVPPPPIPTVLLSFRRRTGQKNVGRVFQDEKVLTDVLKEGNMMSVTSIDLGTLPFRKQLELVRSCNIMVGAHGAGLMHVLFMAEESVLVEIHPSYRLDRHFRLASRMTGKVYLPMRSTEPVTCKGSSDAIPVDKGEFRRTMDAAVRIARSFDDGASECGLTCDSRILALDKGNDPLYGTLGTRKGTALNTKFPCH